MIRIQVPQPYFNEISQVKFLGSFEDGLNLLVIYYYWYQSGKLKSIRFQRVSPQYGKVFFHNRYCSNSFFKVSSFKE